MARRKASPRRVNLALQGGGSHGAHAWGKFSLEWKFVQDLRRRGHETGREWLAENLRQIGRRSSVDLRAQFL